MIFSKECIDLMHNIQVANQSVTVLGEEINDVWKVVEEYQRLTDKSRGKAQTLLAKLQEHEEELLKYKSDLVSMLASSIREVNPDQLKIGEQIGRPE